MKKPIYLLSSALLVIVGVLVVLYFVRVRRVKPGFSAPFTLRLSSTVFDQLANGEPKIMPGTTGHDAENFYGKPSKHKDTNSYIWTRDGYSITNDYFGPDKGGNAVSIDVEPGHTVTTIDGVTLGSDTFASVMAKLRAKKINFHESMDGPEGNWMLFVSFYLPSNPKVRAEYMWFLPGNSKIDDQIIPAEQGRIGHPVAWNSDVFLDKVVTSYTLTTANGSDVPVEGKLSTHRTQ